MSKIKELLLRIYPIFKRNKEDYPEIQTAEQLPEIKTFTVERDGEHIEMVTLADHKKVVDYFLNLKDREENNGQN